MTAAKKRYKRIFLCILGVILVAIFLFPIYWMIISSLKSSGEIFKVPPSFVPESLYLENYLSLFRNPDFFNYIKNSTIISVFSMIGAIILAAPMAYALARKKVVLPKGRKWICANTKKTYEGGQTIYVETPMDTIPVFTDDEKLAEVF